MPWCLDFGFSSMWRAWRNSNESWFMYVYHPCTNSLQPFKNYNSRLSNYVSFIEIAGIRSLCMSLSLIKYSSHLKENIKKHLILLQSSLKRVCTTCWLLHFTNNFTSFFYSYIAVEVPFQFIKEIWLQVFVVTVSIDSSESIKHLNYSLHLNCTAVEMTSR